MTQRLTTPLVVLFALFATACTDGWSRHERELINTAAYSRMRVSTVTTPSDSLLLRTPSAALTEKEVGSIEFGRLIASMIETVNDPENSGVGIAAPQVGILRRIIVVQRVDKAGCPFEVYVNPEIVEHSATMQTGGEGCLSVPNLSGVVERHESIRLRWRDAVTFELREETIEGFTAVIFQHEIDHLNGILYTDRAERLTKE